MKPSERIVKVEGPDGRVHEMSLANARDLTRNVKGFKFFNPKDEPVEQKAVVGEQRAVEDAVPGTESDPSPENIEPEEVDADVEEVKSRRRS